MTNYNFINTIAKQIKADNGILTELRDFFYQVNSDFLPNDEYYFMSLCAEQNIHEILELMCYNDVVVYDPVEFMSSLVYFHASKFY